MTPVFINQSGQFCDRQGKVLKAQIPVNFVKGRPSSFIFCQGCLTFEFRKFEYEWRSIRKAILTMLNYFRIYFIPLFLLKFKEHIQAAYNFFLFFLFVFFHLSIKYPPLNQGMLISNNRKL